MIGSRLGKKNEARSGSQARTLVLVRTSHAVAVTARGVEPQILLMANLTSTMCL